MGRIAGVPVLLHWTLPVAAVAFGGGRVDLVALGAFLGLVLIHELGHLAAVKAAGAQPTAVRLTGYGGECTWNGAVGPIASAAISFSGIFAQLLVLAAALGAEASGAVPRTAWAASVFTVATVTNVWVMALNLLPIAPLDGAEAWKLPYRLGVALRSRFANAPTFVPPGAAPVEDADDGGPRGEHADEARSIAARLLAQAREEEP